MTTNRANAPKTEAKRPRLGIFLPNLNGGGAEAVMLALAERFSTKGITCDLIIAENKGHLLDQVPFEVRLIKLKSKKTIPASVELARYIRRERPDTLISTIYTANVRALIATLLSFSRTRIVIREVSPIELATRRGNPWRRFVDMLAVSLLYRRADAAICLSEGVKESLSSRGLLSPSRLWTIPNPLFATQPIEARRSSREADAILACGRLEPVKDHATLLQAFAKVRTSHDVKLTILGDGSLRAELENQANELGVADHVHFFGFVSSPIEYMLNATVFVHTSRHEGFGNVLLEAIAARCPIVATNCPGGVKEVLANGKYGTLVPVGDDDAIAAAIRDVLDGRVEYPDPDDYLRKFDIDRIADRYLSVLFPRTES